MLNAMPTALVDTRAFDGCVSVETFVDSDNPDAVLLDEQWESRVQQEAYLAWRGEGGLDARLEPVLAEPIEMRYLDAHPA